MIVKSNASKAYEAADCGLLSSDLAAGIRRVKGLKKNGVRMGNWLTAEQARGREIVTWVRTFSARRYGGLHLRSGAQRFYEGPIAFSFLLFFSGIADVCEWYDDQEKCFRIEVSASNRTWGELFGYSGRFQVEWKPIEPNSVPHTILPLRVENRR
jgi:hypothetical protein